MKTVTLEYPPKMINETASEEEIAKVKSVLELICWRCHKIVHSKRRKPKIYEKYFEEEKSEKPS